MQHIKSRQRTLFTLLVDEKSYKPTSYFSTALRVSHKTIYNDIGVLNHEMQDFHVIIEKAPRHGLMLLGKQEDIERFQVYLMENALDNGELYSPGYRRIKLIRMLFIDVEEVSLLALETEFFVTMASLRSDLESLQHVFKPFHISLSTNKGIVVVEGKESDIQKALKYFIVEESRKNETGYETMLACDHIQQIVEDVFDKHLIHQVKHTLNRLIEMSARNLSDYYVRSIYVVLMILISRVQRDYHIRSDEIQIDDISSLEPYMIAIEIVDTFEKQFGLKFHKDDITFLNEQLFAHGIIPATTSTLFQDKYIEIVDYMIHKMSHLLETDLRDDEKLRNSLLFHIPPMMYRLRRKIKVVNPLLKEIRKQYIILFSLTWYVASDLELKYDVLLDDDEISFLFIYFQVSLEKRHGIHFKNIVIVCPLGLATSELVFTRIRGLLPARDNVCTKTVQQLYDSDLHNIDFVISTVKLKPIEPAVIYVSPLLNDKDMERITQHNALLNKQMNTLQTTSTVFTKSLSDYLHDDFIFWNRSCTNKTQCLNYLISEYEKRNYVTKDFGSSMFEREAMGDTSMYTGVALPHALPDTVKTSCISFMTLKNKIPWGDNQVNIIIVIGIAQKDINCIKEVLSKLFRIMEMQDVIEHILATRNKQELMQVLQEVF